MKYEDYIMDKIVALEKFIKNEDLLDKNEITIAKALIEAHRIARLRGHGAEIAGVAYYIDSAVDTDKKGNTVFYATKVEFELIRDYLKKYNATKIIGDFFFNEKKKEEKRTAGFGSDL